MRHASSSPEPVIQKTEAGSPALVVDDGCLLGAPGEFAAARFGEERVALLHVLAQFPCPLLADGPHDGPRRIDRAIQRVQSSTSGSPVAERYSRQVHGSSPNHFRASSMRPSSSAF